MKQREDKINERKMDKNTYPIFIIARQVANITDDIPLIPASRAILGEDFKGMTTWVDTGISGSTGVFLKHMLFL
jgi:hypothetical protein